MSGPGWQITRATGRRQRRQAGSAGGLRTTPRQSPSQARRPAAYRARIASLGWPAPATAASSARLACGRTGAKSSEAPPLRKRQGRAFRAGDGSVRTRLNKCAIRDRRRSRDRHPAQELQSANEVFAPRRHSAPVRRRSSRKYSLTKKSSAPPVLGAASATIALFFARLAVARRWLQAKPGKKSTLIRERATPSLRSGLKTK